MCLLSYFKHFTLQISVAITYFLVAVLALNFATISGNVTLIWPASGIALACIARLGIQYSIGVFLGAFLAGMYVNNPHYVSALIALGNTLEPLLAIYLLRFLPFATNLYHIHDYRSFVLAGSLGAFISAVFGSFSMLSVGYISYVDLSKVFIHWWMADAIGVLLIAPFLLMSSHIKMTNLITQRMFEFVALIVLSVLIATYSLTDWNITIFYGYKGSYLLIIPLFWAILRFGQRTTALIVVEYFFLGIYGLTIQQGIFVTESLQVNLHLFWAYFVVISIGSMILSYIINDRNVLYLAINNSHTETYVFCENDMHFQFVNKAVLDNQKITAVEALELTLFDINPMFSKEEFNAYLDKLLANDVPSIQFETFNYRKDGSFYPVEVNLQKIKESNCYMASITDISDRKKKEMHRMLGNHVCDLSSQAIMITNKKNNIIRVNEAFTAITGYQAEEVIGKNPHLLNSGRHAEIFFQQLWDGLDTKGIWNGDIYNRRKNGELYLQNMTIKVLHSTLNEVENYIAMFTDITKEREQTLQLKHLAEHDVLTKLPNRMLFREEFQFALNSAKRRKQALGLLYLDLNDFKQINDDFGHTTGDEILQEVASRMEECIRETDIVARIGGDEFIILITDITGCLVCQKMSDKLKEAIKQPILIEKRFYQIKTSIGIALYPEHGNNFEKLLDHADLAMFKDKDKMKQITKQ